MGVCECSADTRFVLVVSTCNSWDVCACALVLVLMLRVERAGWILSFCLPGKEDCLALFATRAEKGGVPQQETNGGFKGGKAQGGRLKGSPERQL